jgi:hypothetical protein
MFSVRKQVLAKPPFGTRCKEAIPVPIELVLEKLAPRNDPGTLLSSSKRGLACVKVRFPITSTRPPADRSGQSSLPGNGMDRQIMRRASACASFTC